jgi:hypothetical protein
MIARIWQGHVPLAKAQDYVRLMEEVALPDYRAITGNLGAWCLHRELGDVVEVRMLTFWASLDAIAAFAGAEVERAKYYEFDPDYLVEMVPTVEHFAVTAG